MKGTVVSSSCSLKKIERFDLIPIVNSQELVMSGCDVFDHSLDQQGSKVQQSEVLETSVPWVQQRAPSLSPIAPAWPPR